ncbi:hypothetical protein PUN28_003480 [Cardiocondyla obscurior]|uniref:Uncharacterized protein n=1 Tax=Cardiocondyla obscurior TaxID=286306 RepID=A0AAW2GM47_9HYME
MNNTGCIPRYTAGRFRYSGESPKALGVLANRIRRIREVSSRKRNDRGGCKRRRNLRGISGAAPAHPLSLSSRGEGRREGRGLFHFARINRRRVEFSCGNRESTYTLASHPIEIEFHQVGEVYRQ